MGAFGRNPARRPVRLWTARKRGRCCCRSRRSRWARSPSLLRNRLLLTFLRMSCGVQGKQGVRRGWEKSDERRSNGSEGCREHYNRPNLGSDLDPNRIQRRVLDGPSKAMCVIQSIQSLWMGLDEPPSHTEPRNRSSAGALSSSATRARMALVLPRWPSSRCSKVRTPRRRRARPCRS